MPSYAAADVFGYNDSRKISFIDKVFRQPYEGFILTVTFLCTKDKE